MSREGGSGDRGGCATGGALPKVAHGVWAKLDSRVMMAASVSDQPAAYPSPFCQPLITDAPILAYTIRVPLDHC